MKKLIALCVLPMLVFGNIFIKEDVDANAVFLADVPSAASVDAALALKQPLEDQRLSTTNDVTFASVTADIDYSSITNPPTLGTMAAEDATNYVAQTDSTYTNTVALAGSAIQIEEDPVFTNWLGTATFFTPTDLETDYSTDYTSLTNSIAGRQPLEDQRLSTSDLVTFDTVIAGDWTGDGTNYWPKTITVSGLPAPFEDGNGEYTFKGEFCDARPEWSLGDFTISCTAGEWVLANGGYSDSVAITSFLPPKTGWMDATLAWGEYSAMTANGFIGDGAGLTNLNYSSITNPPTLGTMAAEDATNYVSTNAVTQTVTSEAAEVPSGAAVTSALSLKAGTTNAVLNWTATAGGTNYIAGLTWDATNKVFVVTETAE
jgi:hypothetical protein